MNEERASAARELTWLLFSLDETVAAIRSCLSACLSLLDPAGPISTLPLSTARSEALKGTVTRTGARVTRGEMHAKMSGLPPRGYRLRIAPGRALALEQLVDVGNYVAASLELLGEGEGFAESADPKSVVERLGALYDNVVAARTALKGASSHRLFPFHAVDPKVFDPPLPPLLAFDLYISEAAIIAELRTLDSLAATEKAPAAAAFFDISPFGFRERFEAVVGIHQQAGRIAYGVHGNPDEVFTFHGTQVKVRELVRVESQDPSLMAAWAKLGGLEHVLGGTIESLRLVMKAAGIE